MTGSYNRFGNNSEEYFRQLITGGDIEVQPEESPGIMSRSRFAGSRPPVANDTPPEQPEEPNTSFFENFARMLGRSSDDPERVAEAVLRDSQPVRPTGGLDGWEEMPSIDVLLGNTSDQTRAALGEAEQNVNREATSAWDSRTFTDTVLRRFEGTEAHASLEGGRDTAAFGVKFSRGLNREDYESDLDFAAAVAQSHYDSVASTFSSYGQTLASLPVSVQNAVVDLHYNTGTIGNTAEKDNPVDMMRNTLDFIGVTASDGTSGSLISLAKRRAENWNAAASDIVVSRITSVEQVPTRGGGSQFRYLDADGNPVHTVTSSRAPITFTGGTSYRVNTQTRRMEIE